MSETDLFGLLGAGCGLVAGVGLARAMRRQKAAEEEWIRGDSLPAPSAGHDDEIAAYIQSKLPKSSVPSTLAPLNWTPKTLVQRSKKLTLEEGTRIAELAAQFVPLGRNSAIGQSFLQDQDGVFPSGLFDTRPRDAQTASVVQRKFLDMQASIAQAVGGSPFRWQLVPPGARWESCPTYVGLLVGARRMLLAVLLSDWLTRDERASLAAPWTTVMGDTPEAASRG